MKRLADMTKAETASARESASRTHIHIRCEGCGNALRVERAKYDPPLAVEMTISCCNICDRGDFESVAYFDTSGSEVLQLDAIHQ
jgi:hypothetical protein